MPQFDGSCVTIQLPLSIIELSSTYGFLANLLLGLTVGAVAFVLGKREAAPPHTVALLSSGVVILAIDSFLFATVQARRPPVVGDAVASGAEYVCYLSWTLAMPAVGMLMVGVTVLVASIGWMIFQYTMLNDINSKIYASLGGIFTLIALLATTLALINISIQYLVFMNFPAPPPSYAKAGVWVFSLTVAVISGSMIMMRTVGLYRYRKYNNDWGDLVESRFKALATACISIAAYGLVGIVVDAMTVMIRTGEPLQGLRVVWLVTGLCLAPLLIYLPIGYGVPGTKFQDSWKRYGTIHQGVKAEPSNSTDEGVATPRGDHRLDR